VSCEQIISLLVPYSIKIEKNNFLFRCFVLFFIILVDNLIEGDKGSSEISRSVVDEKGLNLVEKGKENTKIARRKNKNKNKKLMKKKEREEKRSGTQVIDLRVQTGNVY